MSKKTIKDSIDHMETWLIRSKQVADAAPNVKKQLDILKCEAEIINNRPPEAALVPMTEIDTHAEILYNNLSINLKMLSEINPCLITDVASSTASSSSVLVNYVSAVSQLQTPEATKFANNALDSLSKLREEHDFPNDVRLLLDGKVPAVKEKFDLAYSAYEKYMAGHSEAATVALELRTYLEGLKGELFELAREKKKENMNFDKAFERLYKNSKNKIEVQMQIEQHSTLIAELSSIAKRRDTTTTFEIKALLLRILNFSFILLSQLKENYSEQE